MSLAARVASPFPPGAYLPFAGAAAPAGWLLCYGQAVSRATYAALFQSIGTAHGVGDGTTTFNLPDLRGRVPGGMDNMGGAAAGRLTTAGSGVNGAVLGASGGAEAQALTTAQMPSHNHGVNDPGHGHSASQDDHTHSHSGGQSQSDASHGLVTAGTGLGYGGRAILSTSSGVLNTITSGAASAGGVYIGGSATGISTQSSGTGTSHNNTQPTLVANYIIKT